MSLLLGVKSLFFKKTVDESSIKQLMELLLMHDVSHTTAHYLVDKIKKSKNPFEDIQKELLKILKVAEGNLQCTSTPFIIFMYGVNGSGKTTSIVKLVNLLQQSRKKVLVAACDTFRSAAPEQLSIALSKLNCQVVVPEREKTDPASIAFIASQKTIAEGYDVLIIDTAGRLHTNSNLMDELSKIHRVVLKNIPNAHYTNIAIMDATIGQNSITQIKGFDSIIPISGIIVTKLDTSAKGGALISIVHEMKKKIYFLCFGSDVGDISPFNAEQFSKQFLEANT